MALHLQCCKGLVHPCVSVHAAIAPFISTKLIRNDTGDTEVGKMPIGHYSLKIIQPPDSAAQMAKIPLLH